MMEIQNHIETLEDLEVNEGSLPIFSKVSLDTMEHLDKESPEASYMNNQDAFGSILYKIAKKEWGEDVDEWETDTILMNLQYRYGSIPEVNIEKILSFVALSNTMDGKLNFFNEVNCFRHTTNVLNNLEADYEFLGALIPQHCHWAIYEVQQLYPEYEMDSEPLKFMALSYHHVGALVLPVDMQKYQEFLNDFNENVSLAAIILEHWEKHKERHEDSFDDNDIVDLQLSLLKSDEVYMNYKKQRYLEDLSRFGLK